MQCSVRILSTESVALLLSCRDVVQQRDLFPYLYGFFLVFTCFVHMWCFVFFPHQVDCLSYSIAALLALSKSLA
jgi:hypothetical protein